MSGFECVTYKGRGLKFTVFPQETLDLLEGSYHILPQ